MTRLSSELNQLRAKYDQLVKRYEISRDGGIALENDRFTHALTAIGNAQNERQMQESKTKDLTATIQFLKNEIEQDQANQKQIYMDGALHMAKRLKREVIDQAT